MTNTDGKITKKTKKSENSIEILDKAPQKRVVRKQKPKITVVEKKKILFVANYQILFLELNLTKYECFCRYPL